MMSTEWGVSPMKNPLDSLSGTIISGLIITVVMVFLVGSIGT